MNKRWISVLVIVLLVLASMISTTVILAGGDDALDSYKAKLAIMVEEGKLTQEQADAKLQAVESKSLDSTVNNKFVFTDEALQQKLAAMVTNGTLTQDQADEKLRWLLLKKK